MKYNYRNEKNRIISALKSEEKGKEELANLSDKNSKNPFWITSLFVSIKLVDEEKKFEHFSDKAKRLISIIGEQVKLIFSENEFLLKEGVCGDSFYSLYNGDYKDNLVSTFRTAYKINTFSKMLNKIIEKEPYPRFIIGIGLSCSESAISIIDNDKNDVFVYGDSVKKAYELAQTAKKDGRLPICMNETFYWNIIEIMSKENGNYKEWIKRVNLNETFYECNIINESFNTWIMDGMN